MRISKALLVGALGCFLAQPSLAQEVPPVSLYKQMLKATRDSGWVAFRDFNGQQWVYFTPLVSLHCRATEIRYSINSDELDQLFPVPECVAALPFSMPSDSGPETIALNLPLGSAQSVTVQVLFDDDSESEILTFIPCEGAGDSTCAVPAQ